MDPLALVTTWPVDHAAAVLTWRSAPGALARRSTGDGERPFALASVTKLLAAVGIAVAVEEGTLALDAPAGPPGSTVRHLLAHASGLGPDDPHPITRPATKRIYSNAGFDALAAALAQAAGMSAARYVTEAVLEPLGLRATTMGDGLAHGATGTAADLARFADELWTPSLIDASTHHEMVTPQFPDLVGVLPGFGRQDPNPWGLGVEVRGHKTPHWSGRTNSPATYGHFGRAGTLLWVDPVAEVTLVVLTDRAFGPWAVEHWPVLADAAVAWVAAQRAAALGRDGGGIAS